jgi:hypothetical protein
MQMEHLVEIPNPFVEELKQSKETGMGYWVVAVELKNGKVFDQVAASEGCVVAVRGYEEIPFTADEIESITVNHKNWNFRGHSERKVRAATA